MSWSASFYFISGAQEPQASKEQLLKFVFWIGKISQNANVE